MSVVGVKYVYKSQLNKIHSCEWIKLNGKKLNFLLLEIWFKLISKLFACSLDTAGKKLLEMYRAIGKNLGVAITLKCLLKCFGSFI